MTWRPSGANRSIVPGAAAMLVLVVVLLAGALLFLRRDSASLRTVAAGPTGTSPAAASAATSQPVQPTTLPPTAQPRPTAALIVALPSPTLEPATNTPAVATAIPQAARAPGAQPGATVVLEVKFFNVNGTMVAIYPGTPTPTPPWWERTEQTPEALVQALVKGYLHFWDVRVQVLSTLNPSPIYDVMANDPLNNELAAIDRFRTQGQAQRVDVDHSITVLWATDDEGAVTDTLTDRSTMVDLSPTPQPDAGPTAEPTTTPPADTYRMAYRLERKQTGTWQVVDSVRIVR